MKELIMYISSFLSFLVLSLLPIRKVGGITPPLNLTSVNSTYSVSTFSGSGLINASTSLCALIRDLASSSANEGQSQTTVPAQLAFDCLNSVPLHVKEAIELIDSLPSYVQWQTTLPYLLIRPLATKNPRLIFSEASGYIDDA